MVLDDFPISNNNKKFLLSSISQGLRLDNRNFTSFRDIELDFDPQVYGQVCLKLGTTKVLAKVSSSVIVPLKGKSNEGSLVIGVEFSNFLSSSLEPNKVSDEEILLSRYIEKNLRYSRCLDLEGLCILANQKVFQIKLDIHFLNNGGNLLDAANLVALAALAHFRRPEFSVKGHEVQIFSEAEKPYVPLILHHFPIAITFASFNDGEHILVDPDLEEESICQTKFSIAFNYQNEICCLSKPGTLPIDPEILLNALQTANFLSKKLIDLLKAKLAEV